MRGTSDGWVALLAGQLGLQAALIPVCAPRMLLYCGLDCTQVRQVSVPGACWDCAGTTQRNFGGGEQGVVVISGWVCSCLGSIACACFVALLQAPCGGAAAPCPSAVVHHDAVVLSVHGASSAGLALQLW